MNTGPVVVGDVMLPGSLEAHRFEPPGIGDAAGQGSAADLDQIIETPECRLNLKIPEELAGHNCQSAALRDLDIDVAPGAYQPIRIVDALGLVPRPFVCRK